MFTYDNLRIALSAALLAAAVGCADAVTAPAPGTSPAIPPPLGARDPSALAPVDLGALGGSSIALSSEAHDINASGDIVGFGTPPGLFGAFGLHAILWRDGAILDLGTLGGTISRAWGINADGVVVGGANTAGDFFVHAFVWRDGTMTDLGTLDGANASSVAFDISSDGSIVGRIDRPNGSRLAVLWEDGAVTDLGSLGGSVSVAYAINPAGAIVGASETATGEQHAFLWREGTMVDLGTLGGTRSTAYAINPRGDVVGSSTTATGEEHAVLWREGTILDLGAIQGRPTVAMGINPSGEVVGYFAGLTLSSGGAFVWERGVMTELPDALNGVPQDELGPGPTRAYAITPSGDIVGAARGAMAPHAALWTRK